jgi:hypothetical protein
MERCLRYIPSVVFYTEHHSNVGRTGAEGVGESSSGVHLPEETEKSDTQLTAAITAADIAQADTVSVTVENPAPGGGTSNALPFPVNSSGDGGVGSY